MIWSVTEKGREKQSESAREASEQTPDSPPIPKQVTNEVEYGALLYRAAYQPTSALAKVPIDYGVPIRTVQKECPRQLWLLAELKLWTKRM